jgi:hypothetical protein
MQRDISRGIDPIPAQYDINRDVLIFRDGAMCYEWQTHALPFTTFYMSDDSFGRNSIYADRALVLKHGKVGQSVCAPSAETSQSGNT